MTIHEAQRQAVSAGAHWLVHDVDAGHEVEVLIYRGKLWCFDGHTFQRFSPTVAQLDSDGWLPVDTVHPNAP